jgi:hypothetical protein
MQLLSFFWSGAPQQQHQTLRIDNHAPPAYWKFTLTMSYEQLLAMKGTTVCQLDKTINEFAWTVFGQGVAWKWNDAKTLLLC